jgi:thiosulfate reductase cytochrome b subunit
MKDNDLKTEFAIVKTELKSLQAHFSNHLSEHKKLYWLVVAILLEATLLVGLKCLFP